MSTIYGIQQEHSPTVSASFLADFPQLAFLRSVLLITAVGLFVGWLIYLLTALPLDSAVTDSAGSAQVEFTLDRVRPLLPIQCVTVRWAVEGVQAVYLADAVEDVGVVGQDSRTRCGRTTYDFTLTVDIPDGTRHMYHLKAQAVFHPLLGIAFVLAAAAAALSQRGLKLTHAVLTRLRIAQWSRLRWVLLGLAILVNGVDMLYAGSLFGVDQSFQIASTHNLLNGQGISLAVAENTADLSQWTYTPLVNWPPGYALLLAPLWALTGDLWWSSQIILLVGMIAFFVVWLLILETPGLRISAPAKAAVLLYWTLIYPVYLSVSTQLPPLNTTGYAPTDLLGLVFFSASLMLVLRLLLRPRIAWGMTITAGVMMALSVLIRYAYWPFAAVAPAGLIIYALFHLPSRRHLVGAGIVYGISAGMVMIGLSLFQASISGSATLVDQLNPTPVSLLTVTRHLIPFPALGVGFAQTLPLAQQAWWPAGAALVPIVGWGTSAFILLTLAILSLKAVLAALQARAVPATSAFFYGCGVMTTGLTFVMLFYLTYRYYVRYIFTEAERYYLSAFPFLVVALFAVAFAHRDEFVSHAGRWMVRGALLLVAVMTLVVGWQRLNAGLYRLSVPFPGTGDTRLYTEPQYSNTLTRAFQDRIHQELPVMILRGPTLANIDHEVNLWVTVFTDAIPYAYLTQADAVVGTSQPISVILALADYPDDAQEQRLEQLCEDYNGLITDTVGAFRLCEVLLTP